MYNILNNPVSWWRDLEVLTASVPRCATILSPSWHFNCHNGNHGGIIPWNSTMMVMMVPCNCKRKIFNIIYDFTLFYDYIYVYIYFISMYLRYTQVYAHGLLNAWSCPHIGRHIQSAFFPSTCSRLMIVDFECFPFRRHTCRFIFVYYLLSRRIQRLCRVCLSWKESSLLIWETTIFSLWSSWRWCFVVWHINIWRIT